MGASWIVVGRAVTQAGRPVEDVGVSVMMSFDPAVSQFAKDRLARMLYGRYGGLSREYAQERPPHPAGKFTLEYIVPGATLGLAFGQYRQVQSERDIITLEPLKPGERRDVGKLVIRQEATPEAKSEPIPSKQAKSFDEGSRRLTSRRRRDESPVSSSAPARSASERFTSKSGSCRDIGRTKR